MSEQVGSAFPPLPEDRNTLPDIPGGWGQQEILLRKQALRIHRPADPDLFLDDPDVNRRNELDDYMPYWAFLWPAAVKMASVVAESEWGQGTRVLEIGSGLGVVGIAGLQAGYRVTFSDYDETALHLCRLNSQLNGFTDPATICFDWRDPPEIHFPVIIGCEVTYDADVHDVLLTMVQEMLEPEGICWLGDPGRMQGTAFSAKARAFGFNVQHFDEAGSELNSPTRNTFQLLRLQQIDN